MWYGIKIIGYMCLGFIIILIVSTLIVNQIRRNKEEIARNKIEELRPECHPIITSLDGKVVLEYPCTQEIKEL